MGFADRDYAKPAREPQLRGFQRPSSSPVVRILVIINVAIFLFSPGLFPEFDKASPSRSFFYWGALSPFFIFKEHEWWRLFTSMFLHGGFLHLLFNMFVLSQFGPPLARALGSLRFLVFYLLCGLAGGLAILGFALFFDPILLFAYAVGASGAIYGVLFALAVITPHKRIMLLIPPIPLKMRTFAFVMAGFGLFIVGSKGNNYGGEIAHLGGGLFGAFLAWKPQLLGMQAQKKSASRSSGRVKEYRGQVIQEAQIIDEKQSRLAQEVDAILDKVSAQGLDSLSEQERETLQRFRAKKRS